MKVKTLTKKSRVISDMNLSDLMTLISAGGFGTDFS